MPEHLRFEDFTVGRKFTFGDHLVTEKAIIDFALEYDPQPMHVDPVAAKNDMMGGLGTAPSPFCLCWYKLQN